jgi:hypothetical protein
VGQIATVRIHPSNPDIAWVAALGNPFTPNKDRGIYKTTDGGKIWRNGLFFSETCGAADVEIQPGKPDVLFASMWRGQRKPWTIVSGAKEGGIYKSVDGHPRVLHGPPDRQRHGSPLHRPPAGRLRSLRGEPDRQRLPAHPRGLETHAARHAAVDREHHRRPGP